MEYALSLLVRFLVAGSVVVGISVVAEKLKNPLLSGLLVMLPSITVVSVYYIGKSMGNQAASDVVFGSLISVPVWLAYAISLYYFLQNMELVQAIVYSFIVFLISAAIFLVVKTQLFA